MLNLKIILMAFRKSLKGSFLISGTSAVLLLMCYTSNPRLISLTEIFQTLVLVFFLYLGLLFFSYHYLSEGYDKEKKLEYKIIPEEKVFDEEDHLYVC